MNAEKLRARLDPLYRSFDLSRISPDPLEFVHIFDDPGDREVAGLIASSLAYGRVEGIKRSIRRVLDAVEWRPWAAAVSFDARRDAQRFEGFRHRFNDGTDIACLFRYARLMIERSGSIGGFFLEGYDPSAPNIKDALASFSRRVLALDRDGLYGDGELPPRATVRFFFPSPLDSSPCKRLNLYLRWMVRRGDSIDAGLWRDVSPSKLVVPLDTHMARICRNIGLTSRKSRDWRMAEEITDSLRALDPEDPVKYDFSICRLGILDRCPTRRSPDKCERCPIKDLCVL
ncbi:MAG TPA: TIGR02757 family protein [Deltaproteobacteria bacterium]|nr:TIGR02757 family protein [Deltaproteobacteria bacterium]